MYITMKGRVPETNVMLMLNFLSGKIKSLRIQNIPYEPWTVKYIHAPSEKLSWYSIMRNK